MKNGTATKQPQQTRGSRPSERGDPLHAGAVQRHSPLGARVTRCPAPEIRATSTAGCCATSMPAAEISTPSSSARAMLTLSAAFPSRSGKSSLTLRNRLGSEDSARGTAAKESARRTDSRELPAELARQHRSLWQGAVCTLRAAIHSPARALSFQVAGLRTLR